MNTLQYDIETNEWYREGSLPMLGVTASAADTPMKFRVYKNRSDGTADIVFDYNFDRYKEPEPMFSEEDLKI